jgi:23S rRNA pseudouridine955/2504/2580 synthase
MREITIGKNDAGQRADNFLMKALPMLPPSLRQKYLRTKRIKRNGARLSPGDRLEEGDVLSLYIGEEFFIRPSADDAWRLIKPRLEIAYEDGNILVADKRPGMLVHSDDSGDENTLINHIKAYLFEKGEWDPARENAFAPALANGSTAHRRSGFWRRKTPRRCGSQREIRTGNPQIHPSWSTTMTPCSGRLEVF